MSTKPRQEKTVKSQDRRNADRWPVTVLVKCSIRQGSEDVFESEMWARDVNERGMKLEWSRDLRERLPIPPPKAAPPKNRRFEDAHFGRGGTVTVQDLFYDDDGSILLRGKILWVRQGASTNEWTLGVGFSGAARPGATQIAEFLNVVRTMPASPEKLIPRRSSRKSARN